MKSEKDRSKLTNNERQKRERNYCKLMANQLIQQNNLDSQF